MRRPWMAPALSLMVYVALTAVAGRNVLLHPATLIIADQGDPLLVAGILHWNAWVLPLSDAWWQFPNFHPTPDTLAFSEHLLGLAPLSTPLAWLIRDPVAVVNVMTLLTFPLCGMAMFALVHRLTGHTAAAFVAGLAFAFSPYRVSQLSHLQMLATFWAPLTLLGLHAYMETRRRRWLVLYATAWLLQVAANAYYLVHLSVLVGLWVAWFVVVHRDWRALRDMAVATVLAGLLLVPLLARYISVHAAHGFSRTDFEVEAYSADLFSLLCAPGRLSVWSWLHYGCRPETELFPGLGVTVLAMAGVARVAGWWPRVVVPPLPAVAVAVQRLAMAAAGVALSIAAVVSVQGPLRMHAGPLRFSASSVEKPLLIWLVAAIVVAALSRRLVAGVRQGSTLTFYLLAAAATWALALGPTLTVATVKRGQFPMPYDVLSWMPGVDGMRVPARFWMISTLCLAVASGLTVAVVSGRRAVAALTLALSVVILADGWTPPMPAVELPPSVPDAAALRGHVVLRLPVGLLRDIRAQHAAVVGGWRSVNGYSGFEPAYYEPLVEAIRQENAEFFGPLRRRFELHVIVGHDAPRLRDLVERQPGVVRGASSASETQYRLPKLVGTPPRTAFGRAHPIRRLDASCAPEGVARATDGDPRTRWFCGAQLGDEVLTADVGIATTIGAIRYAPGAVLGGFPRQLVIETSRDGLAWEPAWEGSLVDALIEAGLETPRDADVVVGFAPRSGRFVRLRQTGTSSDFVWSVAELQVGSGQSGSVEPG